MRNLKKFLALVLAMMMAFSLMVTANAANAKTDYPDMGNVLKEFEEAVDVLSGMGVFRGNNGNFLPQDKIMRCEAVAILYRLTTGDVDDKQVQLYIPDATYFKDVKDTDWFAPYVGFAVNAGYVKGYNGNFNPYQNVTGYEMLAMLLRAVGYGKNGEFTGSQWRINVGSQAESLGILNNINSTHYANTLSQPSPREVVADLTFQTAAYVPTVRYELGYYNPYVGVAVGTGGNIKNQTLGEREFGLTLRTGIVVGNQATGENFTRIGASAKGIWTGATPALTGVELTQSGSYYYYTSDGTGTDNPEAATTATAPNGNVTVDFNFGTDLDLFGHKVNTWYDCRTSWGAQNFDGVDGVTTPTGYSRTYAIIDKANLVATVWADDLAVNQDVANQTSIYTAAVDKGFSTLSNPNWESDRFSQMGKVQIVAAGADRDTIQSLVGMYRVISNNVNKTADVVIALNEEVAQINQVNTTVKGGEYIYLDNGNSTFGLVLNATNKGKLLNSLLAPGSDKTLGDVVTANQIVGTTKVPDSIAKSPVGLGEVGGDTVSRAIATAGTAITIDPKFCRYETGKLEPSFTGTISTYKQGTTDIDTKWISADGTSTGGTEYIVTKVTMTDGTTYDLSGITGSQFEYGFDTTPDSHLINGVTALTSKNTYGGVTYNFYLDEVGRFIGVAIPNDYSFLYTTFADYEIGSLGTGTSGYYVYGVDWNGNIVKDKRIYSITEPITPDATTNIPNFDDATPGTLTTYPGGTPTTTLAVGYNALPVTLKDQGSAVSTITIGNQIRNGSNTRFVVDPAGNLSWYREGAADFGERFMSWWDASLDTPAAINTWTITKADAANGFKRVYNYSTTNLATALAAPTAATDNTDYLLTNSTKFIVVTGSGTADLSVKIYTGLTELLNGGTSAEICSKFNTATAKQAGDNVYFITSSQKYGNTDTTNDHTIDTVIMSNTNLTQYTTQSLFFSQPGNTATGVKLADDYGQFDTVNQYKLYTEGKADYYWISDTRSVGKAAAQDANGTTGTGDFYTLTPIGEINGQTIYRAVIVNGGTYTMTTTGCNVNQRYDYIVVNDLSTAAIGPVTANTVFKVTGATVTQVYGDNLTAVATNYPQGLNISDLQTLNNAVSMGKAGASGNLYDISIAYVNDGINVPTIYVTNIAPAT